MRVVVLGGAGETAAAVTSDLVAFRAVDGVQLLGRRPHGRAGFVDPEVFYEPNEFLAELGLLRAVAVRLEETEVESSPSAKRRRDLGVSRGLGEGRSEDRGGR